LLHPAGIEPATSRVKGEVTDVFTTAEKKKVSREAAKARRSGGGYRFAGKVRQGTVKTALPFRASDALPLSYAFLSKYGGDLNPATLGLAK
jgi:hypothetical protein